MIRAGISGWRYIPWRKKFYPEDLTQKNELHFASRQVRTIEINGSFYSLQRPSSYQKWYADVPREFIFSVKGPRFITHIRRLKDPSEPLANFFASGVLFLNEKLGPCLWQLPPSFLFRPEVLEEFFCSLPRTFKAAAEMAQRGRRAQSDYPMSIAQSKRKLRHALEVRHHSFENPEFIALLRKYDVALVFADTAGKWPYMEDVTSDFIYMRLHGDREIYRSGYGQKSIEFWADRALRWSRGEPPKEDLTLSEAPAKIKRRDVFVYFDNDEKIHAPFDAIALQKRLAN